LFYADLDNPAGAQGEARSHMHCSLRRPAGTGFALVALFAALPVAAQQAPDAGKLLQEQPRPQPVAPSRPSAPTVAPSAAEKPVGGPSLELRGVRFQGNTLITTAELTSRLQGLIGRQVAFSELLVAADSLTAYYAERGYVARVSVLPQVVENGIVEFRVIEGRRGSVQLETRGARIDPARITRFVDAALPRGALVDLDALSQLRAILDDLPGLQASTTIAPGSGSGEVDVRLLAESRPPVTFFTGVDNSGSRAAGRWNAHAGVALANPLVGLDRLVALTNVSEGTRFVRAGYDVALGDRGFVAGLNASALNYRLVGPAFAALEARGQARTWGVTASYPVVRLDDHGLSLTAATDSRHLEDVTVAGVTSDREVHATTVGVTGYVVLPPAFPGGTLSYQFGLTGGSVEQRNAAALAADLAGRATEGSFTKASWRLELVRPLQGGWLASAKARGQHASKNLDSSERFSLGGLGGVRAYPGGEATGDEGALVALEIQRNLGAAWRATAFYDAGRIRQNKTVPAAGIATPNTYSLAGTGLRVEWQPVARTLVALTLATPVGGNPGRDPDGLNADGTRSNAARAWLSLAAQF
jgi:hemolysin activation/secretion protein